MLSSVLVTCVGNICRSPAFERLLASRCPDLRVESAGINALVGHPADETISKIAALDGINLAGHKARQFTADLAASFDLILVMEDGHQREIQRMTPHLAGRAMLLTHWTGKAPIPDPFRKSKDLHELVYVMLKDAANAWASKLGGVVNA